MQVAADLISDQVRASVDTVDHLTTQTDHDLHTIYKLF